MDLRYVDLVALSMIMGFSGFFTTTALFGRTLTRWIALGAFIVINVTLLAFLYAMPPC